MPDVCPDCERRWPVESVESPHICPMCNAVLEYVDPGELDR